MITPGAKERVEPIDLLRGIAITGVIAFHLSVFFGSPGSAIKIISATGFLGVQLFFLISALTMCTMWDRRAGETHQTLKFYIRRTARIAGPFWLAIIFYLLLNGIEPSFWAPSGISLRQIAATAFFVHALWPDTINCVVPGGWSIGVEMLFYLFFPLFMRLRGTPFTYLSIGFLIYIVNLLAVRPAYHFALANSGSAEMVDEFLYFQIFNQGPIFLIGIALYQLIKGQKLTTASFALIGLWVGAALLIKYRLGLYGSPFFWLPVFILAGAVLAIVKLDIAFRPLDFFGRISYSVYLSHFAIIELVRWSFDSLGLTKDSTVSYITALITVIALVIVVGAVMRSFVENPSSNVGRALIATLEESRTT